MAAMPAAATSPDPSPADRIDRASTLGPHRWTAVAAASVLVVIIVALVVIPVPFVTWAPGRTVNLAGTTAQNRPIIQVQGLTSRRSKGEIRMTTVSVTKVDSHVGLAEALVAAWLPHRDALPREAVYQPGRSSDQVKADEVQMMDTSQRDAVVAALRAAGQPVTELPMAAAVSTSGPSYNVIQPGDLITKVDGTAVQSAADIQRAIRKHTVGDSVAITVLRNGTTRNLYVMTASSSKDPKIPVIGISVGTGYRYTPTVTYNIPSDIVGPSAGLMMSLAIYQAIAPADLIGSLHVAGTGEIAPDGTVGAIGGIREKVAGAQRDGSRIFLVPASNCRDLAGTSSTMTLVKVASLKEAISAIQKIRSGVDVKEVPHC